MPRRGINLIPGEERASFEVIDFSRRIKFLATLLVIVFLLVLLACFGVFFKLNSWQNNLLGKISLNEKKIKSYLERESDLVILKDRLALADKIFKKQPEKMEILFKLRGLVPEGVVFESIESGEKGGLMIGISSSDLLALNRFVKAISDPEFVKNFSFAEASSISRSEKGTYSFIFKCASANEKS